MRYGAFIILAGGLLALAPAAQAEPRAPYVTLMLQAFAAKVECPGTDVVYQDLVKKAQGVLVFPDVYKAAIGVGGEYGKGALRVGGKTGGYYSIASGSVGLQLGAEERNIVFMFMTPQALADFRNSSGWQAGANAGVAVVKKGSEGSVDTSQINAPVLVFVFGHAGLMADASVEGTKISKLD